MSRASVAAFAAAGVAVLAPSPASSARTDALVSWEAKTPPEGAVVGLAARTQLSVPLTASSTGEGVTIRIGATTALPKGAVLHASEGNPATATLRWTPKASQQGEYNVVFTAAADVAGHGVERSIVILVGAADKAPPGPPPPPGVYPKRVVYSDTAAESYRWAFVRRRSVARSGPALSAGAVSPVTYRTPEYYRNAIQLLDGIKYRDGKTWVRIRLAILPNGSTGWVPRGVLAGFQTIHTRLAISHSRMRATLYKRGRPIFSAMVGVGQNQYPTPRGWFYVREKLSGYYAPAYGPRAFGLNARSAQLTDWPGGGFVGIHGTNAPRTLPGRVSHGCVRMQNPSIMRLFRLMPVGTPVHIG